MIDWSDWLPLFFVAVMALSMLLYVVLDGFDLGVGILLRQADESHKDAMIASIGPFWDANETWLVLGVGVLLIAFPVAHGIILGAMYLPVAAMLTGLILRGVAFDFRVKARVEHKSRWNTAFWAGSMLAALSQGFMLGHYITGFREDIHAYGFALLIALCLAAGYALLGATWIVMKASGDLRRRAIDWAHRSLWLTGLGIVAVSLATPMISARIYAKWFDWPTLLWLAPIPLASAVVFVLAERMLAALRRGTWHASWKPFVCSVALFVLAFIGLGYSLFPYLVLDRLTFLDAASARESLWVIFIGTAITLPVILAYTAYSYRVFWGKSEALRYD
jgi:cytochrome d ubiquinol oxidase subunit II